MNKTIKNLISLGIGFMAFFVFANASFAATPILSISPNPTVSSNSATFSVFYDDMGDVLTSVAVQYGPNTSMTIQTNAQTPPAGKGTLSFTASNLSPNTTYYFQAIGASSSQTVFSSRYTFTTTNASQNCAINSFSANQNSLNQPSNVTLNWSTSNCNSVSISSVGNLSLSGSTSVFVSNTTTYTLTASGANNSVNSSVTITVNNSPQNSCVINDFDVDDDDIERGDRIRLSWNTSNCNSIFISGIGSVASSGTYTLYPSYSTTYVLNASNNYNSDSESVTVDVDDDNNNSNRNRCEINRFVSDRYAINEGESVRLSWDSSRCSYASLSGVGTVSEDENSFVVYPRTTTTYTLSMDGSNYFGNQISRSLTIVVNPKNYIVPVVNSYNPPSSTNTIIRTVYPASANSNGSVFTNGDNTRSNNLGASAGSTPFALGTFVGWLFFIALILASIMIARHISEKKKIDHTKTL